MLGNGIMQAQGQRSVEQIVVDNCVQHPVTLYLAESVRETQLYKFGERDQEFRQTLSKLIQLYQRTGQDISGERSSN